jgi:hypothetical protein
MPALEDLPPEAAAALAVTIARLKHDLGKYIALQARWLDDGSTAAERLDALRADLLSTRRGPAGSVDATAVWQEFRKALSAALSDPDLVVVDAAMERVGGIIELLRADAATEEDVALGLSAAREVSDRIRQLDKRARSALAEVPWPTS